MIRDPRKPDPAYMVPANSTHPAHQKMRKTLVLLKIDTKEEPVYFVIEGLAEWPMTAADLCDKERFFYEEHTCPTNFIRIPMICQGGDTDPHGVFEFVDAVWMMDEYDSEEASEYLAEVFPQLEITFSAQPVGRTAL
jgi:hypothetical protein